MLYAGLENFSRQEMLTVTTSQNPLPPIKNPTPYVKKAGVNGVQAPDAKGRLSRRLIGCVVTCVDGVRTV